MSENLPWWCMRRDKHKTVSPEMVFFSRRTGRTLGRAAHKRAASPASWWEGIHRACACVCMCVCVPVHVLARAPRVWRGHVGPYIVCRLY